MTEKGPVKMARRDVETTGLVTYARRNLKSSIAFNKRMFIDGASPPSSLVVAASGLRVPVIPNEPARLAERAHRAGQRAQRAKKLAHHLTGVADRHAKRLARIS
jgi:hypothetical protein